MLYLVKARDHMKPISCDTGDLYEMNAQPEKSVQHEACSLMFILHRQILFGTNITVVAFFQYHLAITIKYCQLWPVLLLSWIRNFPSGSTSGFTVDGYGMVFVGRCAAKEREREREEVSFEERQIGSKEINALDLPLPLHSNTLSINST